MKANSSNLKMVPGMRNLFLGIAIAGMAIVSSCSKEEGFNPSQSNDVAAANASSSSAARQAATMPVTANHGARPNGAQDLADQNQFVGNEWRLIVAFQSLGGGIDQRGMATLRNFIEVYQDRIGKQILYQSAYFGREGEVELRFHLREVEPEAQAIFVTKVKQLLQRHDSIEIYENAVRLPE